MLKPIRKKRAYEDIVDQIYKLIKTKKLRRGDQLPNERELSLTFKVSRATVREAFLSLEAMNLLTRRQGDGTYVIASSEEALVQPLAAALFQEKRDLMDIFSLRRLLEPEVSRLAAENATPEEIAEMEKILGQQKKDLASNGEPNYSDINFHQLLARMTRNRVLERLLLAFDLIVGNTRQKHLQSEERRRISLNGHRDILLAIKDGNSKAAGQAMRRHLEKVESIMFNQRENHGKSEVLAEKGHHIEKSI